MAQNDLQLDGLGTFNQTAQNVGLIKYGEFNNSAQNTGVVAMSAIFRNSTINYGRVGNLLPVDAATAFQANSANWNISSIDFVIGSGDSIISTGAKGYIQIPTNFVVRKWSIISDVVSTLTIDIKQTTFAQLSSATSIVSTDPPKLIASNKNTNTNVTIWTNISSGNYLQFTLNSNNSAKLISISLIGIKS